MLRVLLLLVFILIIFILLVFILLILLILVLLILILFIFILLILILILLVFILILVLIAIDAFCSCAEIAVISLDASELEKMAEEKNKKAERLLKFLRQPAKFLTMI